jgi:acetyltransferase-like isoleucine patch superfamily enzyme
MIINIVWIFLDLLPFFARNALFKIIMKEYGSNSFIDYGSFVRYTWKLSVGNNVAINRGCQLYPSLASGDGVIVLKDGVVLGPSVKLFAAGHDYSQLDLPDTSAPIVVERYVWIGGGAIILPGVTIGEGAVIGAGSVVTRDIKPYTVNAGNPARFIRPRDIDKS